MADQTPKPKNGSRRHLFNRLRRAHRRRLRRRLVQGQDVEVLRPEEFDPAGVQQALIVLPNWRMGNLLLATPIAQWLREGLIARGAVDPMVDLCSGGDFATLLEHNPHVRRHVSIPGALRPLARRALWRRLAATGYDLVFVASYTGNPLATRVALTTGARVRIGAGRGNEGVANLLFDRPPKDDPITEQHRLVLDRLGLSPDPAVDPTMVSTPAELEQARATIARWALGEGRRPLGLFVLGHRIKQIPFDRWARIIETLRQDFPELEPVVFQGPGEAGKIRRLQRELSRPLRVVAEALRPFCALVECMGAVVSCDCGPLHLARAKRRPLVSLFTKDNFDKFAPTGPNRICLFRPGGPKPEEVSQALAQVLGRGNR